MMKKYHVVVWIKEKPVEFGQRNDDEDQDEDPIVVSVVLEGFCSIARQVGIPFGDVAANDSLRDGAR